MLLLLAMAVGVTDATGVTDVRGTVIRLFSASGTLVIEVDDPGLSVTIDGQDVVITGAGPKEIRLKPGQYKVLTSKDGEVVRQQLVTVTSHGRRVVRVNLEPSPQAENVRIEKSGGWVSLFNGKDLTGWSVYPPNATPWKVEDGALTTEGRMSYLVTKRDDYVDFHVRVEAKINELGNSGVYGRTPMGSVFPPGYEAQINIKGDAYQTGSLWGLVKVTEPLIKPDTWFTMDLIVEGNRVRILVNGKQTVDYTDDAPKWTRGHISLQHHFRGATRVYFRKVEVKELNKPEATVADPDRRAAEWVLSIGGKVRVNDQQRDLAAAAELPSEPFRMTFVDLTRKKRVTDAGLARFQHCKNLTKLYLTGTPVSDAGLAHFKDCEKLRDLYLNATGVTDAGLAHFKDCKNLTALNLGYTRVTDAGLANFKDCKNLTSLSLFGMPVTDAGLAHFKGCKNLTRLDLSNTRVSDAGLANFKDCKNLTDLNLDGTRVTDAGLAHFKDCKNLTGLYLHRTRVTDAGLKELAGLKSLQSLKLDGAPMTDAGLKELAGFKNLQTLWLNNTQVTDAGLKELAGLKSLQVLHLKSTKVTEAGVKQLAAALPGCRIEWDRGVIAADPDRAAAEYIAAAGGSFQTTLGDRWMQQAPAGKFRLTGVNVYFKGDAVGDELAALLGSCTELESLNLGWTGVTGAGLLHLKDCTKLTDLNLEKVAADEGLTAFHDCKELVTLNLSGAGGNVTDTGLAHFANCSKLKVLSLNHTGITEKGLAALGPLPELEKLEVDWTLISDAGLAQLRSYPQLKALHLGPGLKDEGLAHLAGLRDLIELHLNARRGEFTAKGVANFRNCKDLQRLKLTWNAGSDDVVAEVKTWPALTHLDLDNPSVTDEGLRQLRESKTLESLGIRCVPFFRRYTQAGIDDFRRDRPDVNVFGPGATVDESAPTGPDAAAPLEDEPDRLTGQQAETVRRELRRLNPDFQGVISYDFEDARLAGCKITGGALPDLSPLSTLTELRKLDYEALDPMRDAKVLREMKSLEFINNHSAATFRLAYPANKPSGGVDAAWLQAVRPLLAQTQVDEVTKKLKELNPNFDGQVEAGVDDGQVTSLTIHDADVLTDLSPLRALEHLQSLNSKFSGGQSWLNGGNSWFTDLSTLSGLQLKELSLDHGQITDLTPLKDMPLISLSLGGAPVEDLAPLHGLPLQSLNVGFTRVSDLTPLKGMRLTQLRLAYSRVADLSPLKGMPLTLLSCSGHVADLSPLQGMPLTYLNCGGSRRVSDLSPLQGMPLTFLTVFGTRVKDLSPLAGTPLEELHLGLTRVSDLTPLKGLPLTKLTVPGTKVSDLSPLSEMRLTYFDCIGAPVTDLSPLKEMPLAWLRSSGSACREPRNPSRREDIEDHQ